jgi:hypothetical protein
MIYRDEINQFNSIHVQRLVSVVKMATVLEECSTNSNILLCVFVRQKGLSAKEIHREIFPAYGGKCLLCKAVHNRVEKFSPGRSKVADEARPGSPVETATEATVQLWLSIQHNA